ncbi:MAG: [Fe-Fe] hydrogenase large subunit C-terminal domain-containing protein, partial [bacterium]|nr:[Fe-Fe] hydrogenase large subunit C-terminal domain-containing protein [bacterium]
KNCYRCIRECPVKSIKFSDHQAHIIDDECILCGRCVVTCPQNAKSVIDSTDRVKDAIRAGKRVIAAVAPSFIADFSVSGISELETALQKLGFFAAEETAIGAYIVKTEYENMIREGKQDVIISTCCTSVVRLVQKYYPAAVKYLAHVLSPMQAHCTELKRRFPDAKTVFIGPCISKKDEAEKYPGIVDCVLTFEELSAWLEESGVSIEPVPDTGARGRARLFPTTGGILRTMAADNPDYTYLAIDGVENCRRAIEDALSGKLDHCFVELSACVGSCIGGPAMDQSRRAPVREYMAVNRYAGSEDFSVAQPEPEQLKKRMGELAVHRMAPGSAAIEAVLHEMGKFTPEQELNCGSCGYDTCREKAAAVLQGKADLSMCLPYLSEKAQSFSDNIIRSTPNAILVLNDKLELQQLNQAACHLLNIDDPRALIGEQVVRVLDPLPFFELQRTGRSQYHQRVYLEEYKKYVDQTLVLDRSYHLIICIMRDVTAEEAQRIAREQLSRTTIEVTDRVIEKQMRTVQEIASLLGETTAETKVALTKLKESLRYD